MVGKIKVRVLIHRAIEPTEREEVRIKVKFGRTKFFSDQIFLYYKYVRTRRMKNKNIYKDGVVRKAYE